MDWKIHIFRVTHLVIPVFCLIFPYTVFGELEIQVRNAGKEILKTSIKANTTDDIIVAEYTESDGSLVTVLADFRSGLQIFRVQILGEEERGQNGYQVFCFIFGLKSDDFIPSDAMSKLRQKNSGTIRLAEDDLGQEEYDFDVAVDLNKSSILSLHLQEMCYEAPSNNIYSFYAQPSHPIDISSIGTPLNLSGAARCSEVHKVNESCICEYNICLHWYPCGIKFCKDKDPVSGKLINRRCGIKTCKKCRLLHFGVLSKITCLWDEHAVII
ncbi:Out at first protein [Nymphon striatum]|nr:Out at first protein [Nymphon striatum]